MEGRVRTSFYILMKEFYFMNKERYRFLIHYTLSFIGGYLGLYAIVSRADLFGNAQTANLLGVVRDLIGRDFPDMLLRVGALLIYMTAVILTVWIPEHVSTDLRFISIGIDIFAILLLGFLPSGMSPVVALYPVFFAMPFQWCTFKAPGGYNSSTIFSTNNLRQFTTAVTQFLMNKDTAQRDKAKFYGMTLLSFHAGAALSLILYMYRGLSGVWICLIPALYAVWLISADRNTAVDVPAVSRSTASAGSSLRNLSYKKKEA